MKYNYVAIDTAGDAYDGTSWDVKADAVDWCSNTFASNINELVYSIK